MERCLAFFCFRFIVFRAVHIYFEILNILFVWKSLNFEVKDKRKQKARWEEHTMTGQIAESVEVGRLI
jgi:hypothetical protein